MARRTVAQRNKDMELLAGWYCRGVRQAEIAERLGVTQQTVSNDLQALYVEWQASALVDINEAKTRELARIDELERTYWAEWEASREQRVTTNTKQTEGTTGRKEASVRKEDRLGDPRYLAGVQWCIERRCAILGINAPTKQEVTGKDGGAIEQHIDHDFGGDLREGILSALRRIADTDPTA